MKCMITLELVFFFFSSSFSQPQAKRTVRRGLSTRCKEAPTELTGCQ